MGRGGLTAGTGPRSPPITSPNQYGRYVVVALPHVNTGNSVLSTIPVSLKALPEETQSKLQSPPPQTMLYGGYPPPKTVVLPLSGGGPHSGCDPSGGGDILLRQSDVKTQPISTMA